MKKISIKIISIGYVLYTLFFAQVFSVRADETDLGQVNSTDPIKFAADIYSKGLFVLGGVALLFIMYGGYLLLFSKGDPVAVEKGKSFITYAIIGVVLAVAGFALYQIITTDVLKIPGFSK